MKLILIILALTIASCSSYRWVDLDDCKEKVSNLGKCREVN